MRPFADRVLATRIESLNRAALYPLSAIFTPKNRGEALRNKAFTSPLILKEANALYACRLSPVRALLRCSGLEIV